MKTFCTLSMRYKPIFYSKCSKAFSKFNIKTITKLKTPPIALAVSFLNEVVSIF